MDNIKTKNLLDSDTQKIIEFVFNRDKDYKEINDLQSQANELRNKKKQILLKNGFDIKIFYPLNDDKKEETIFYDLQYGFESKLASTGLWGRHFKDVFLHEKFKNVIHYIVPEINNGEPWNFSDKNKLKDFCIGIFNFDITSYKESLPIRLATYFYPELLLPIFKIDHLENICKAFGFETDANSYGDKIFIFNSFLLDQMNNLEYSNIIKQNKANQVYYTVKLLNRLKYNENYNDIIRSPLKKWEREFYENGYALLTELNIINY